MDLFSNDVCYCVKEELCWLVGVAKYFVSTPKKCIAADPSGSALTCGLLDDLAVAWGRLGLGAKLNQAAVFQRLLQGSV